MSRFIQTHTEIDKDYEREVDGTESRSGTQLLTDRMETASIQLGQTGQQFGLQVTKSKLMLSPKSKPSEHDLFQSNKKFSQQNFSNVAFGRKNTLQITARNITDSVRPESPQQNSETTPISNIRVEDRSSRLKRQILVTNAEYEQERKTFRSSIQLNQIQEVYKEYQIENERNSALDLTKRSDGIDQKEAFKISQFYQEEIKISDKIITARFEQNRRTYTQLIQSYPQLHRFLDWLKKQETDTSAYSIFQQLAKDRLVLHQLQKGFPIQQILALYHSVKPKSIRFVLIENCQLHEHDLAHILTQFEGWTLLQEVILKGIFLDKKAFKQLIHLSQKLPKLTVSLSNCHFEQSLVSSYIENRQTQIQQLSLSNCNLTEHNFQVLEKNLYKISYLDISRNQVKIQSMLSLLAAILTSKLQYLSLNDCNLNSDYMQKVCDMLCVLVIKPSIQHVDLTNTQIDLNTVQAIVKQIKNSKSLQSIHFTNSRQIKEVCKSIMQNRLFNRMTQNVNDKEINRDWFKKPHIPNLEDDDISAELIHSLSSHNSYVLQRMIGRPDLSNFCIELGKVEETESDDNLVETEPELREKELRLRHTEKCWVESHECWICQRWRYCLPFITKTMLEDSYYSEKQTGYVLTQAQERVLERFILQEKLAFEDLPMKQAFIIGEATNMKLIQMETLGQYMSKIDDQAEFMFRETEGNIKLMNQYYIPKFKQLMEESNIYWNEEKSKQRWRLLPYKPHLLQFDQMPINEISPSEQVWVHSCMLKPGFNDLFVIYRLDSDSFFKGLLSKICPIRQLAIHQCKFFKVFNLKIDKIPTKKTFEKKTDKQTKNPFKVLKAWQQDTQKFLQFNFNQDVKLWQVRQSGKFEVVGLRKDDAADEYESLIQHMSDKLTPLIMGYKFLLSNSCSFPLLNFKEISHWVTVDLELIDGTDLTKAMFENQYRACKQFSLQRTTDINNNPDKKVKIIKRSFSFKKQKKEHLPPDNELTRFMFYELIVRLSALKYKMTGVKAGQTGFYMTPCECFDKFMIQDFQPWLQRTNAKETSSSAAKMFIQTELMDDERTNEVLFKNQFGIHRIYQVLLQQFEETDEGQKDKDRQFPGEQPIKQEQKANKFLANILQKHIELQEEQHAKEEAKKAQEALANPPVKQNSKSPKRLKGSLKNKDQSSKKNLKLVVKREFLNLGPPLVGLGKDFLFEKITKLSEEFIHLLTNQMLQYFYTNSKVQIISLGNQRLVVEQDILRWQRLSFVEFVVFICFVANLCYSLTLVNGFNIPFQERLKFFLQKVLPEFGEKYHESEDKETEENKLVGIDKIEQILLQGKITQFQPLTPYSQVQSFYPEMFSRGTDQ